MLDTRWYSQLGIPAFAYGGGRLDIYRPPDLTTLGDFLIGVHGRGWRRRGLVAARRQGSKARRAPSLVRGGLLHSLGREMCPPAAGRNRPFRNPPLRKWPTASRHPAHGAYACRAKVGLGRSAPAPERRRGRVSTPAARRLRAPCVRTGPTREESRFPCTQLAAWTIPLTSKSAPTIKHSDIAISRP